MYLKNIKESDPQTAGQWEELKKRMEEVSVEIHWPESPEIEDLSINSIEDFLQRWGLLSIGEEARNTLHRLSVSISGSKRFASLEYATGFEYGSNPVRLITFFCFREDDTGELTFQGDSRLEGAPSNSSNRQAPTINLFQTEQYAAIRRAASSQEFQTELLSLLIDTFTTEAE